MRKIVFGLALALCCAGSGLAQNPKWQAWEAAGDTLLNKQDFQAALKLYSKVIHASKAKDQTFYGAVYKRAVCYYSLGKFETALQDLDTFIPAYPESPQAHLLRALVRRELGDNEGQLIDLEQAIAMRPDDPELLKWRATLYLDQDKFQSAKEDILKARETKSDPELETYLGLAYYNLDHPDSALMALNRAIELDATYLPAYFYAGSFCVQESEFDLALTYINLALRLDPKNPTALFYKGVALVEKNKIDEGCSCLNKAFYLGNDDAGDYLKEYCYPIED